MSSTLEQLTSYELFDHHASNKFLSASQATSEEEKINPNYEPAFERKYRVSKRVFEIAIRVVFLDSLLRDESYSKGYSRLVKDGAPIWCYNLKYEGLSSRGYRRFSFTLENELKRFIVDSRHALLIPSRSGVTPKFYDGYTHRCKNFGSVFAYAPAVQAMFEASAQPAESVVEFFSYLKKESPFRPGALITPRLGLFSLVTRNRSEILAGNLPFPYGVVLKRGKEEYETAGNLFGRESYEVMFGSEIYKDVHPNELEIVSHV
jgi:hypothetical protein